MAILEGQYIEEIILPSINGEIFRSTSLEGQKYMISFFRFASCPFCNLRVHELVRRYTEFGEKFSIVAIFDSSVKNLTRHTSKHEAAFPILADENNKYYKSFQIKKSILGMLAGIIKRIPSLLKSLIIYKNIPWPIKGSILTMPADFLIDEEGRVVKSYYGKDEGDHLPIEQIVKFSNEVGL